MSHKWGLIRFTDRGIFSALLFIRGGQFHISAGLWLGFEVLPRNHSGVKKTYS